MPKTPNQKTKILLLAKMFVTETDESRGLTMPNIIERLAEAGISAERKAIYRDIDALREFGLDIKTMRNPGVEYYLANRNFDISELLLMTDAIQSSRFLTADQADRLALQLQTLASTQQRWQLEGRVHVEGRIKEPAESAFANVDAIRAAITRKRKISFNYAEFNLDGTRQLRKDGKRYTETPVSLVYSNNLYYLISFNETHDAFLTYRVDRMEDVQISEEASVRNERIATYDAARFEEESFGMFGGAETSATFFVHRSAVDSFIDRFDAGPLGTSPLGSATVVQADEEHARIRAKIIESPVFFGWLAQFGNQAIIESPRGLAERFQEHLQTTLASYE